MITYLLNLFTLNAGQLVLVRRLIFVVVWFNLSSTTLAQNSEEEDIKAVIKAETMAYYGRNADAWQATWLQDAKATRTLAHNNSYSSEIGWENIKLPVLKDIKEEPDPIIIKSVSENFIIRSDGTMAWVEFDALVTFPNLDPKFKYVTREHRALMKKEGQWKIFSQITHYPESFAATPQAIEDNLNMNGYHLLTAKKVKEAIELLKVTVRLYPQSAYAYHSLGKAYAVDSNKDLAIKNYEKSIQLDPKNENGKAALAKLKEK